MAHGGRRAGSGRKPRAEKYERQINAAEKKIADTLPALIDRQIDLALGVLITGWDPIRMKDRVYQSPPDRQAGQYLIDKLLGKATERLEHSGPDGGPIEAKVTHDHSDAQLIQLAEAAAAAARARDAAQTGTPAGDELAGGVPE